MFDKSASLSFWSHRLAVSRVRSPFHRCLQLYLLTIFALPVPHDTTTKSLRLWATLCNGVWFSGLNKSVKWMIKWITHVSHLFLYWMNQCVVHSNESVEWLIHRDNTLSPPTGVKMNSNILKYLLKGSYNATCTFPSCLNWNVCWQCVHNHPIMIQVHPVLIAFSNEVTRMEAPSTIVDWQ